MKRIVLMLSLLLALPAASPVAEDNFAVLDLDGDPWNGPDFREVALGDLIEVDVWLHLQSSCVYLISYGVTVCNYDGSLEYQSIVYHHPEWTSIEPTPGVCFDVQGTDYTWGNNPIQPPALVATITYRAAVDESIDDLTIISGAALCTGFVDPIFAEFVGATVSIGMTGTSQSSWGSVKGMFR